MTTTSASTLVLRPWSNDDIDALFASACADADLLLISAASAARLSPARLNQAQRALSPLLLVLPGTDASLGGSELAQRVRERLALGLMRLALFLTGKRY